MLTVGPPGPQCWLMVALLVLRIWLADLLARCQGFRSVLGYIVELLWMQSSCICVARRGDLFVWRASNTDNASMRKTVGEHGSKESLTIFYSKLLVSSPFYLRFF